MPDSGEQSIGLFTTSRLRRTPFWQGVLNSGVREASVYNHMLFPCVFESLEDDYHHLKRHVQIWDVSCQRQVELQGPDAGLLLQMMTPRLVGSMKAGRCYYVPAVDHEGRMLNDPVVLKHSDERFWVSVADSDLLLYALGIVGALKLNVRIVEPDISPLAVQGPKSAKLVESTFGRDVLSMSRFEFRSFEFSGKRHAIARTGFSGQDGFEIFVEGADNGMAIWNALHEVGRDLCVRSGGPNYMERVESGLLSYGGDITREHTPYEAGLGGFCDTEAALDCMGRDALLQAEKHGLERQIRCVQIDGPRIPHCGCIWPVTAKGSFAGKITAAAWSPDFRANVAIAMIEADYWDAGTTLDVDVEGEVRSATVRAEFFG